MCFTIEGVAIVELARDLLLESDYDRAEDFLVESLAGMTRDIAEKLLEGTHTLIGANSSIEMVEDDNPEHLEKVADVYRGCVQLEVNGPRPTWWTVDSYWQWGASSRREIAQRLDFREGLSCVEIASWLQMTKANRNESVIVRYVEGSGEGLHRGSSKDTLRRGHYVFLRPIPTPPPWIRRHRKDIREVFFAALNAGQVEPRYDARDENQATKKVPVKGGEFQFDDEPMWPDPSPLQSRPGEDSSQWPVWDSSEEVPPLEPWAGPRIPEIDTTTLAELQRGISEERLEHAREQIKLQADDSGWLDIPWGDKLLRVPRGAFECWGLHRTVDYHKATPWRVLSGYGWKQIGDNPYHTDWLLGAGLRLSDWNTHQSLRDASYEAVSRIQCADIFNSEALRATVLVAPSVDVVGRVVHAKPDTTWHDGGESKIVVLPNLSPRYSQALAGALAFVAEDGGALAHMSQIGRERGLPVLRLKGALEELPEDIWIRITPEGQIERLE